MKASITFLTLALMNLAITSCTTAKKSSHNSQSGGLTNLLAAAQPVSEAEIESLKSIANSPSSMLSSSPGSTNTIPLVADSKPHSTPAETAPNEKTISLEKWRRPGLNPDEVNPGDIFTESAGPILNKALSIADELPAAERRTLLNYYTSIKTSRVPMTLSRRELTELQSRAEATTPLPSRSVSFDFRSESRSVASERLEELLAQLARGEQVEAVESKERQSRLKSQIASVRKRLKAGERLFVVTAVTESEGVTASYPGGAVTGNDAELISNALLSRFPHLNSIEAEQADNTILITGNPRVLWEFETSEILLENDRLVIGSQSIARL